MVKETHSNWGKSIIRVEPELIDELTLTPDINYSQMTAPAETIDVGLEKPVEVNKRVSVAWLCFDKEKVIKKNGLDYRKCNQPNCGVMYQVVEGTATSMSRHVQRRHRHLLQKNNLEKHKQTTISYSGKKTKLMPSFSQDSFNTYLVDYKADKGHSAEDPQEIFNYVKSFFERDYAGNESTSRNPSPAKKSNNLLRGIYKTSTSTAKRSEIDVYISEPVVENNSKFQVLDYWKVNSFRFPLFSRMARDYLAVPGTSTPSERAFSGGRQLITDFCCRLKGETITAFMLLKNWRRQWDGLIQTQGLGSFKHS